MYDRIIPPPDDDDRIARARARTAALQAATRRAARDDGGTPPDGWVAPGILAVRAGDDPPRAAATVAGRAADDRADLADNLRGTAAAMRADPAIADLLDAVADAIAALPPGPARWRLPRPGRLPAILPGPTYGPYRAAARAADDGPTGRGWVQGEDGDADRHRRDGEPYVVTVGDVDDDGAPPWPLAASRGALKDGGQAMHHVLIAAGGALAAAMRDATDPATAMVTIDLDDLAARIGLRADTADDAARVRRETYAYVRTVAAMRVIAQDATVVRASGRRVAVRWQGPMWHVDAVAHDHSGAPVAVAIIPSRALADLAPYGRHALPDLGDAARTLRAPRGRASGSWAVAITHALRVRVRIGATLDITTTRRHLLCEHPGAPHPDDLLADPKSGRHAVGYWAGAIAILREARDGPPVILDVVEPPAPTGRGWAARWLDATVTVRCNPAAPEFGGLDVVREGRARHAAVREGRAPRRRRAGGAGT